MTNLNTKSKSRGFTIVELLVVIVVIGILAAISIVSYTGVTNKAKDSKAQQNADSVAAVANVYSSDNTAATAGFPSLTNLNSYNALTKLPAGVSVIANGAGVLTTTNADTTIIYQAKGTTGACIAYMKASDSSINLKYVGDATTGTNFNTATATCN